MTWLFRSGVVSLAVLLPWLVPCLVFVVLPVYATVVLGRLCQTICLAARGEPRTMWKLVKLLVTEVAWTLRRLPGLLRMWMAYDIDDADSSSLPALLTVVISKLVRREHRDSKREDLAMGVEKGVSYAAGHVATDAAQGWISGRGNDEPAGSPRTFALTPRDRRLPKMMAASLVPWPPMGRAGGMLHAAIHSTTLPAAVCLSSPSPSLFGHDGTAVLGSPCRASTLAALTGVARALPFGKQPLHTGEGGADSCPPASSRIPSVSKQSRRDDGTSENGMRLPDSSSSSAPCCVFDIYYHSRTRPSASPHESPLRQRSANEAERMTTPQRGAHRPRGFAGLTPPSSFPPASGIATPLATNFLHLGRIHTDQTGSIPNPFAAGNTTQLAAAGRHFDSSGMGHAAAFPVVIFVQGGAWRSGRRRCYASLAKCLRDHVGAVVFVPDYAGYPEATMLTAATQVAHAISWVSRHCCLYGGDPQRITIVGHSAGAHLVSLLAALQATIPVLRQAIVEEPSDRGEKEEEASRGARSPFAGGDRADPSRVLAQVAELLFGSKGEEAPDNTSWWPSATCDAGEESSVPDAARDDPSFLLPPREPLSLGAALRNRSRDDKTLHFTRAEIRAQFSVLYESTTTLPPVAAIVLVCGVFDLVDHVAWERHRGVDLASPLAWSVQDLWYALSPSRLLHAAAAYFTVASSVSTRDTPTVRRGDPSTTPHPLRGNHSTRHSSCDSWLFSAGVSPRWVVSHVPDDQVVSPQQSADFVAALDQWQRVRRSRNLNELTVHVPVTTPSRAGVLPASRFDHVDVALFVPRIAKGKGTGSQTLFIDEHPLLSLVRDTIKR